jgi:hypothetical protein
MRKIYFLSFSLLMALVVSAQVSKPKQKVSAPILFEKGNFKMPPSLFAPGCDTLLWSSTTISQYGAAVYVADGVQPYDSGYLSGLNAYNDRQKGNFFNVSSSSNNSYVTAVRFAFLRAKSSDMSKTIFFRVYDVGTDITLAGSSPAIPLSSLTGVIGGLADYTFPAPIPLTSKRFIVSVDFSNLSFAAGDSFAIFQNNFATSLNAPDSAVEQFSTQDWDFMSSSWGIPYGMFVYLFPYVSDNTTCALPVKLTGLSAAQIGNANKLKWTTQTEIGNKGFEIERSQNGITFSKLDFVASKADLGTSTQSLEYEFIDNSPFEKSNYYRIKQIDQNGKTTFTNVVHINREFVLEKGILAHYPNPVKNTLNLQLAASSAGNSLITVTNVNGVMVMQQAIQATGSLQNLSINVASLPKGTYFVKLSGEATGAKFIKE